MICFIKYICKVLELRFDIHRLLNALLLNYCSLWNLMHMFHLPFGHLENVRLVCY